MSEAKIVRGVNPFNTQKNPVIKYEQEETNNNDQWKVPTTGGTVEMNVQRDVKPITPIPDHVQYAKSILENLNDAEKNYLKTVHLMIGTPCYGNNALVSYMQSSLMATNVLHECGVRHKFVHIGTESLITRARNGMMAEFLGNTYTHMLFIDADIGYGVHSIIRLLLSQLPVVSAIYPLKKYNWDDIVAYARRTKGPVDTKKMLETCNSYVFNAKPHTKMEKGGFMEAMDLPTGFMMIQKGTAIELARHLPRYTNDVPSYDTEHSKGNFYDFFPIKIDEKSGRYLSEDYAFSRICQDNGIKTYVCLLSQLTHTGSHQWNGSLLHRVLSKQTPTNRMRILKELGMMKQ